MYPESQWSVMKKTVVKTMEATFRECPPQPRLPQKQHNWHSMRKCALDLKRGDSFATGSYTLTMMSIVLPYFVFFRTPSNLERGIPSGL